MKAGRTVAVLCVVPLIMVLGNSMLIPVLPTIQKQLSVSSSKAGLLITLFSIPAGIVIPFAGLLSDRIGRKKVMVPALIVYGIGGLLAGLAAITVKRSFNLLLIARVIQGIGAGGTYQLAMALVGDVVQSSGRAQALGMLEASNGLGKVISPLAGASLALISWYVPFFVYGVLALPAAIAVGILAKEPSSKKKQQQNMKDYWSNLRSAFKKNGAALAVAFLAGAIALFALFGLLSYFSDILEKRFHYAVFRRGLVLALPVLVMAIVSYTLGTVLKKHVVRFLKPGMTVGLAIMAAGMFLFALFKPLILLVVAGCIVGLGTGTLLPSLNMLVTSSSDKARGGITCLYGTVRFFGVAIGPPLFGIILFREGPERTAFWLTAGAALLIAVAAAVVIKAKKILPEEMTRSNGDDSGVGDAS